jgi:hypothetical protein
MRPSHQLAQQKDKQNMAKPTPPTDAVLLQPVAPVHLRVLKRVAPQHQMTGVNAERLKASQAVAHRGSALAAE